MGDTHGSGRQARGVRRERKAPRPRIDVRVLDVWGNLVPDAEVQVNATRVPYSPRLDAYTTEEISPGRYQVRTEAHGLEPQEREVILGDRPVEARFILGKPGLPHYFRGPVKVPYDLPPMVAVVLKPTANALPREVVKLAMQHGLEPERAPAHASSRRVRILRANQGQRDALLAFEREVGREAERSPRILEQVQGMGHVVFYNDRSLSFLTNECVVKFQPGVDGEQEALERKLRVVRKLPYSANAYVFQAAPHMTSIELLDVCNAWVGKGSVLWAEPNLISTVVAHGPDPDFGKQGHHALIGSQAAWTALPAGGGTRQVSTVLLAVPDLGCLTTHEDFDGILSPNRFNFSDNTDTLMEHPHGTQTCGIAAAVVNNDKGIAGVAGFPTACTLMAVQVPTIHTDSDGTATQATEENYAAMLLWCAGLPTGRALPAPLPRGADVISNSWGLEGMSESGAVSDALTLIAISGRGGLGCVVVFSTGNNGTNYASVYPLLSHDALIRVAASTVLSPEVRVGTSNYGSSTDVCAPAGDGNPGTSTYSTTTSPSFSYLGDYDWFGETSAACPQVAGTAALMLAVNPALSAEEVRTILHETAVQIDSGNADVHGRYEPNGHSQWYGYGRIDADAAVTEAQTRAAAVVVAPAAPSNVRIGS